MILAAQNKEDIKKEVVKCLAQDREIKRIVIFGSFLTSPDPNDLDIAIFQDSTEPYLPLAMKYRQQTRDVARRIPVDIIPLQNKASSNPFLREIESGETIYER